MTREKREWLLAMTRERTAPRNDSRKERVAPRNDVWEEEEKREVGASLGVCYAVCFRRVKVSCLPKTAAISLAPPGVVSSPVKAMRTG